MYGFYIYKNIDIQIDKSNHCNDEFIKIKNYLFAYKKFEKFHDDKIFYQDETVVIGLDGVILNSALIKKRYNNKVFSNILKNQFLENGINFINELKGEFSGFYYQIQEDQLFVFVNKTVTKPVFYTQCNNQLIVSPTVNNIIKVKNELRFNNELNTLAVYQLFSFGSLLDDNTLVNGIYKITAGSYLLLDNEKLYIDKYYDYNRIEITNYNASKAVNQLNDAFLNALDLEYSKDKEYNFNHLATLSGGLDSRMNVILGSNQGNKIDTFCFSQSQYWDHLISKEIAKKYNLNYVFFELDNGNYLLNLFPMLAINDGLQNYNGASHYHFALSKINLDNYGLIHTGQIGDGLLGGYVSNKGGKGFLSKIVSYMFVDKLDLSVEFFNQFRDEEVFKLYQRAFNCVNFGSYATENLKTYLVSPFLDADFVEIALSIDPKLKFNEKIYINWIKKLHPYIADFAWERTKMKPDRIWKTELSRYTNYLYKKWHLISNNEQKLSMNPFEYWYKNNDILRNFYHDFYAENIGLLALNSELNKDARAYFENGFFTEKAILITLLGYIKIHNLKV